MIEKMKAVYVVSQAGRREELLTSLQTLGTLHIAEQKAPDAALLERFSRLSKLMLDIKPYAQDAEPYSEILSDEAFEKMYQDAVSAIEKKDALEAEKAALSAELERLKPWGNCNAKMIRDLPAGLHLRFYKLDKKACEKIAQDDAVQFIRLGAVENMEAIATLGEMDSAWGAIEFIVPETGTLEISDKIAACENELSACEKTLKEAAKHLKSYKAQLLKVENDASYDSARETLTKDGELIWLRGYIPEGEMETFIREAKAQGWAYMIGDAAEDDGDVPTKIRYGKLTGLISPIFSILGVVPGYREYDISFWFLAFFTLFFAMIIGDAGYGAVFLLGTILFHCKTKKTTNIILLLYVLSVATMIWGSLTGTWFGLAGAMEIPILKALVIPSLANYPQYFGLETGLVQNNVMKFCFSIGVIQLALACIMNIRRKIAEKSLGWISDVGWLLSISALYFMVLNLVIGQKVNFAMIVIAVGAGFMLVVLFGGMAPGKTFGEGLRAGVGDAFTVFLNTISAFGNLMSYIRLFAVGMASLAIAQSFNDMAAGFDGPLVIAGIAIMAIGHLLNIIMGFLSVVVHGVRLNLLEFSGQLGMEWSGTSYEPFRKIKK